MIKRFLIVAMAATLALSPVNVNACSCNNRYCVYETKSEIRARKTISRYINKYLKRGKYKKFKVKFIRTQDLTLHKLETRKRNHIIFVEMTKGYVVDRNNYDGITSDGYYISYEGIDDRIPKGSCLKTYCIFNPRTNGEDDVIYRTDRVLNTNKNKSAIRKAKKMFKNRFGYSYKERR